MTDAPQHSPAPAHRRLSQRDKMLVDYGPLVVFFLVYFLGQRIAPMLGGLFGADWRMGDGDELFAAIAAFMPAFAIAFIYSVWKERRIAPMLLVSFVIVGVLGSLTLFTKDRTFFYMKPTLAYGLFSATLAGGLLAGRNFLRILFDGALQLPDDAWRTLTIRYAIFFAVLALANEIAWRWLMAGCDYNAGPKCPGEPTWINVKVFGFTAVNVIFAGFQAPLIMKHLPSDNEKTPTADAATDQAANTNTDNDA